MRLYLKTEKIFNKGFMGMGTYKIQEELTGFTIITGSLPDLL
jgi:hypothetical protein